MAHHTNGATTVWHFKHIQEKLLQKEKDGDTIPADLSWILKFDVNKKITADIKNQRKIDWLDYVDLLPDVEIPSKYKRKS